MGIARGRGRRGVDGMGAAHVRGRRKGFVVAVHFVGAAEFPPPSFRKRSQTSVRGGNVVLVEEEAAVAAADAAG